MLFLDCWRFDEETITSLYTVSDGGVGSGDLYGKFPKPDGRSKLHYWS
jgi:hypothetical protein